MNVRRLTAWWVGRVTAGWGERAGATLLTGLRRSTNADGTIDARAVGEWCATRCHSIEEVLDWVSVATERHPRSAMRALGASPELRIAAGWADGMLSAPSSGAGAEVEELRLRVHERFALASSLGIDADGFTALVVANVTATTEPHTSTALAIAVRHARRVFRHGDTVAQSPNGTILVLTDRSADLAGLVSAWHAQLHAEPTIRAAHVWVESMGRDAAFVDSLLSGLVTNS